MKTIATGLCFVLAIVLLSDDLCAQILKRPLLKRDKPNAVANDAVAGPVLGAGFVTFELAANTDLSLFTNREFMLSEKNGRVLYPVYDHQPVKAALRDVLGLNRTILGQPLKVKIHFLFRGNEPLELNLYAGQNIPQTITVRAPTAPADYDLVLQEWWSQFNQTVQGNARKNDYPLMMDQYLSLMLSRRLNLAITEQNRIFGRDLFSNDESLNNALGPFLGAESVRLAMQKEVWFRDAKLGQIADQPLPRAIQPPPITYSPPAADVQIEPLAMHVPHECLYVRFGSFQNFLWFQDKLSEWGGDLRNLIAFRAVDYGINAKLEKQLAMRRSATDKLFGPAVIADVALIGQDTFFREGAGHGLIFQAKNNFAFGASVRSNRGTTLKENIDAKEETVKIADHDVSFLYTPDNRIRSFYAVDGDFHLVTTSRRIVERFYEAGAGRGSLGASVEFRSARTAMPISRLDHVFAYLSDEFFRTLTSPAYRIEMTRRMQSLTEFDEWQMAQYAAQNEGVKDLSPENLIKLGYLAPLFNQRADGSQLTIGADNKVIDSLRGGKGSFIPIGDVVIDKATLSELNAYNKFASDYAQLWTRMDPVMLGIKRYDLPKDTATGEMRERMVMDLHIAPVVQRTNNSFFSQMLAAPDHSAAHPLPEDVVMFQFVTGFNLGGGNTPNHYAIGMRNSTVQWRYDPLLDMVVPDTNAVEKSKLYFTAWPEVGLLQFLGAQPGPQQGEVPAQNAPLGHQMWQRNRGETLSVVSWDRETLRDVANRFPIGKAERPAQMRLYIGDVGNSKMREFSNALGYFRCRQVSAGNVQFMHQLHQQLGVALPEAKTLAESMLLGTLVDPLGGKYELADEAGQTRWRSSAWTPGTQKLLASVPADFLTPPLHWFRGLSAEVSVLPTEYNGHIELDFKVNSAEATEAVEPAKAMFQWPKFDLLEGGPLPAKPGQEKKPAITPAKTPEEIPAPNKRTPPPAPMPD
jgi:hypothetical protein